jgi:thiol-disulfide isomerase/thioredoxin
MKKFTLAVCFILITAAVSAAEINFLDNPVWATVLEKAKKENKMIFLDAYATWCGPCKNMDAQTYTNQAVADYYNANFINVKYDMEKGEGPKLADQYFVNAYPNLVFISPNGEILHKGVGFLEAAEFVALGKAASDPATQYYTLKKNALQLDNAKFVTFTTMAVAFEDEDLEQICNDYLAKQADILANKELIYLVMETISSLPDEKTLAYFIKNKDKIVKTNDYSAAEVEERAVSLTLGYALSPAVQTDYDHIDFVVVKRMLDQYIPERSFFVLHYFKAQYLLDNKKTTEAIAELDELLTNSPEKVTFDQVCNAMMNMGPILLEQGKLDEQLKKFEAVHVKDTSMVYMKDFVKALIYIKAKDFDKFKVIANQMIASNATPENVKKDLKEALEKIAKK